MDYGVMIIRVCGCSFRRRQLAQLGSATGVYKTLVKYLVGVPQVWSSSGSPSQVSFGGIGQYAHILPG